MSNMPERIPVLHIITGAPQNARGIMELIDKHNEDKQHWFMFDNTTNILSIYPEWIKYNKNSLYLPSKSKFHRYKFIKQAIERADRVIMHGMNFTRMIYYFVFHWHHEYLEKCAWIEWGADLYEWRKPENKLINKKLNEIGEYIRRNVPEIILCFPGDELFYRQNFGDKARLIDMPLPTSRPMLPRIMEAYAPKRDNRLRVQIAHNGLISNHHIRVLDSIARFRDEDIQVVLPFAYNIGDLANTIDKKAYKSAVLSYAKYCFGKKAVPFLNMITLDYYMKYLWSVDIIIFDINRPYGITNLLFMLYMGKKVFLPADCEYYQYLTAHGLTLYDTRKIKDMTYEEFSAPAAPTNKAWIENFYDYERNHQMWYDYLGIEIKPEPEEVVIDPDKIDEHADSEDSGEEETGEQEVEMIDETEEEE